MATAVNVGGSNNNIGSIFGGNQPKEYIYEDEQCFAFDEDYEERQAPVHFVVVPKKFIPRLVQASESDEKLLGHVLLVAKKIATEKGIEKTGFRVVINDGSHALQKAEQFHVQVLGHILLVAKTLAIKKGLHKTGYHVMVHDDHQKMKLKAIHVFGRALHHMLWPVGPGCRL